MGLLKTWSKSSAAEGRVGNVDDVEDLVVEEFGYDQAYRRVLGALGAFALVLAVASPLAGFLIISIYQIAYGGYWGLSWGWIIPAILFLPQPLAVAELASSMPVNGANYWWTAALAPPSLSRPLSFISGWVCTFQGMTNLASFAFASATTLATIIPLLQPQWTPTNAHRMAIAMGVVILWGLLLSLRMERLTLVFIVNCTIALTTTFAFIIGLPVSHAVQKRPFTSGADVFGEYTNFSTWDRAVAVPFTFFSFAWVVTGCNAPSLVAEETHNARVVVPRSILHTYITQAVLGLVICLICAFCAPNIEEAASDPSGLPFYTMILDHWGLQGGAAFILLIASNALIAGSSLLFSTSGQVAAFARDGGLPFSKKLAYVHPRTNIPIYSSLTLVCGTILILLFGLSAIASTIIFSLAVIALLMTMAIPISLRVIAGERFVPGPFSLGILSKPVHLLAFLTLIYIMIMEAFPTSPNWTGRTFNYNWVVAVACLLGTAVAWYIIGSKYKGVDLDALNHRRIHAETVSVDLAAKTDIGTEVISNSAQPGPDTKIAAAN